MVPASRLALALMVASACGRIGYDPIAVGDDVDAPDAPEEIDAIDAPMALEPIHLYNLQGNLDDVYGGPSLQNGGGTIMADGYHFAAQAGLAVTGGLPARVYTVELWFSFDMLGTTWRKILDFKQLGPDEGLYTYFDHLQYVVVAGTGFENGATVWSTGTTYQVTLTRDAAGQVNGYVDRVWQFGFDDTAEVAALPNEGDVVHFFIDDATTGGGESSGGVVRKIRIWDVALTEAQLVP